MSVRVRFRLVKVPKRTPYQQWRYVYRQIEQDMQTYGRRLIIQWFGRITANWTNTVIWQVRQRKQIRLGKLWTDIRIKNRRTKTKNRPRPFHRATLVQVWYWLWLGTQEHPIKPRGLKVPAGVNITVGKGARGGSHKLWFRHGLYNAKTRPGSPPSYGGPGSRSGPFLPRDEVMHPGFGGRDWISHANLLTRRTIGGVLNKAVRRGFRGMTG